MDENPREEAKVLDKERLRTFLLGGAAGVLAGILLAPRSGRETRGSIADRAGEARERSRENFFDRQERVRERFAKGREGRSSGSSPRDAANLRGSQDLQTGVGPYEVAPPEDALVEDASVEDTGEAQARPRLRDVSHDAGGRSEERPGAEAERAEELRRKVRETRARLRGRLDDDGTSGTSGASGAPPPEFPGDGGETGR